MPMIRYLLWALAMVPGLAQDARPRKSFEVASVKMSSVDNTYHLTNDPSRFEITRASLRNVLMTAYQVPFNNIVAPDWVTSEVYDIQAKKPEGAAYADTWPMLQSLLADRFGLAVHWEKKDVQGYALLLGKGNPKMPVVEDPGTMSPMRASKKGAPSRKIARKMNMKRLAEQLASATGVPVVNATGLITFYDVTLEWSSDDAGPEATAPPLSRAVESQLGLRLEPRKIPTEFLMVDGGHRVPTGN